MTIRVIIQFADDNLFILIFYYELYKLHIDISFHTKNFNVPTKKDLFC